MERFVDREMEMDTLQNEYRRNGSSLVVLMAEMGILLSVSRHSYQRR